MRIVGDTEPCPDDEGPDAYFQDTDQGPSPTSKKRPQDQTNEEWLAGYCSAEQYRAAKAGEPILKSQDIKSQDAYKPLDASPQVNQLAKSQSLADFPAKNICPPTTELCFRYIDHRTTRKGSVVLMFESLDGRITAVAFFNVCLKSNRGSSYPSGKRGQFIPKSDGNFRTLWMRVVGKPPSRWCRVHKYMRSNLRGIIFTGRLTEETDGKGQKYFKLRDVEPKK